MAKKVIVDLEARTKGAEANLQDVVDAIKELKKETKEAEKNVDELGESGEKSKKGLDKVSTGFKGIGLAWKAIGIGAIISAFLKLSEILGKNQKAADFFKTVFEGVNIVINDFVDLIINSVQPVKDFFKNAFENPKQTLIDFGQAIKDNLIERFNSFLDTLGYVADAITKVFEGDFSGALDSIKDAGKELVDVYTGVDNSVDKITNASGEYIKKVKKQATEIVKLSKNVELLKAVNDGLIESYDVQAEKQRQIRDDETLTFSERKKANDELGRILEEQGKIMKANAQTAVDLAEARKKENNNDANKLALQEALNEQAAIEARVTGQLSEQKVNAVALDKEILENKKELLKIGKEGRELAEIESQQELDNQIMMINKTIENEEDKFRLLEAAQKAHDKRMSDYDKEQEDKRKEKEAAEKEKRDAERAEQLAKEEAAEQRKRDIRNQTFEDAVRLAGQESKVGKALLLAKALINAKEMIMEIKKTISMKKETAKRMIANAVEASVNSTANVAEGVSATAKVGFPKNIPMLIGFAAQAAGIIGAIKSAVSTAKSSAASLGGGGSIPTSSASVASIAPSFNVVGANTSSQLASVIGQQTNDLQNTPQRAYVVSSEVTTAQSLDRNIIDDASLGD